MAKRILIVQGGGPTAVINRTLSSFMASCVNDENIETVIGYRHTFDGAASGDIFDLLQWSKTGNHLALLKEAPGAFLGSSRTKTDQQQVKKILDTIERYKINTLVGIGGNGTMQSLKFVQEGAHRAKQSLAILGIAKTVDNDLEGTFISPGFASAAQYVAQNTQELGFDFQTMSTFDDVLIFETMGRNTGWLAAASVAYKRTAYDPPHLVYTPEMTFDFEKMICDVQSAHQRYGRVFIVCSEALTNKRGEKICTKDESELKTDSLGRTMYSLTSGTGQMLAQEISLKLGLNTRTVRPGILGRGAMGYISIPDKILAEKVGHFALKAIKDNVTNKMIGLDEQLEPKLIAINDVANIEKHLLSAFMSAQPPYINSQAYQKEYLNKCLNPVSIELHMPYND